MKKIISRGLLILSALLSVLVLLSSGAAVFLFIKYAQSPTVSYSPDSNSALAASASVLHQQSPVLVSDSFYLRKDIRLYTGTSYTMPEGDEDIRWYTSDPKVVSIQDPCTITAHEPGTAVVIAESAQGVRLYGVTVNYSLQNTTTGQSLTGNHLFVYNVTDDAMAFSYGDINEPIFPASLTKLMTAYVAMQYLPADSVFTAGEELLWAASDSSMANLRIGHSLNLEQLMAALILPSGNDVAMTIAVQTGRILSGDPYMRIQDAIVVFMNEVNRQADALGLNGTYFTNPHGYHDPDHRSTVADLITISCLVMEDPLLRRIASLQQYSFPLSDGKELLWTTHVSMLRPDSPYYCPYVTGLKTGYTTPAGYCVIVSVEFEGKTYLVGSFGAKEPAQRDMDILILMEDYIFSPFANK